MSDSWSGNAGWDTDDGDHPHEANYLKLDCSKAKSLLRWKPIWKLERALEETVRWYKAWHGQEDMHEFTLRQIALYQKELPVE
jgi:CDP-glucose 4,6-dehydratase